MKQHIFAFACLAALLLVFALLTLLSSERLANPIQDPQPADWTAPSLSTPALTPTPTPGWWHSIVTPTTIPIQP